MKPELVRDMSADQLDETLLTLRKSHMEMRFQQASGQFEKIADLRKARRDIARIKTEINRRAMQSSKQQTKAGDEANA